MAKATESSSIWAGIAGIFVGPGSLTDFGERFLILDKNLQTSVKGMFAIGDVTGTPDIKAALNAGYRVGKLLGGMGRRTTGSCDYDVVIVGAGPAGISAASELMKVGKKVMVLERRKLFQTIRAFAKSKALFLASTGDRELLGDLSFEDSTAQECLDVWERQIAEKKIEVREEEEVTEIKQRGAFEVWTKTRDGETRTVLADRVIVAVGKLRLLEKLEFEAASDDRIRYQLRYSGGVENKKVLVVAHPGSYEGFEMALELCPNNAVTLIYEEDCEPEISPAIIERLDKALDAGRLIMKRATKLGAVQEDSVTLLTRRGDQPFPDTEKLENDIIYSGKIIDKELPATDLRSFGLNVERRMSLTRWVLLGLLAMFFAFVYMGKSDKMETLLPEFSQVKQWIQVHSGGARLVEFSLKGGEAVRGPVLERSDAQIKLYPTKAGGDPRIYELADLAAAPKTIGAVGGLQMYQWWVIIYSLAIVGFGIKAIHKYRSQYRDAEQGSHQTRRLLSLMFFQVFFLAILPELILGNWRAYGIILAWPLNLSPASYAGFLDTAGGDRYRLLLFDYEFSENHFYFAWTLFFSFVLIPILVWRRGMQYCTWICSCGGLAETVGDDWRQFSPKGPANTRRERFMYVVLGATALIMLLAVGDYHGLLPATGLWAFCVKAWSWVVDLSMCGIIPLVLYPYLGGRTWCRFACPTAGFMKLMSRKTSVYGIQPERARCIACGTCDHYCEVGVPIKKHALRGQYFSANDTTCISCGVCVSVCPTDVLSFQLDPAKRSLPMNV